MSTVMCLYLLLLKQFMCTVMFVFVTVETVYVYCHMFVFVTTKQFMCTVFLLVSIESLCVLLCVCICYH